MSFRAEVFVRLRDHAQLNGESAAAFVERAVTRLLDIEGAPKVERSDALKRLDSHEVATLRKRAREATERLREMGVDPFDQNQAF